MINITLVEIHEISSIEKFPFYRFFYLFLFALTSVYIAMQVSCVATERHSQQWRTQITPTRRFVCSILLVLQNLSLRLFVDRESTPQQSAAVGTPVRARVRRDEERGRREECGEESNSSGVADDAPTPKVSLDLTNASISYDTPSAAAPPLSGRVREFPSSRSTSNTPESRSHSRSGSREGNPPPPPPLHKPGSPLVAMHRRLRSEADLNTLLRGYNRDTQFLYKDITKALGPGGKAFMMERMFWNILFMSVVTVERSYLGWNENTADLYQR